MVGLSASSGKAIKNIDPKIAKYIGKEFFKIKKIKILFNENKIKPNKYNPFKPPKS